MIDFYLKRRNPNSLFNHRVAVIVEEEARMENGGKLHVLSRSRRAKLWGSGAVYKERGYRACMFLESYFCYS
jgi:hypothetical protein